MRLLRVVLAVVVVAPGCGVVSGEDARSFMGISLKPDKVESVAGDPVDPTGGVRPARAAVMLRADSIEMRRVGAAGEAGVELVAEGDVVMTRGADRFHFRRLAFNLETEVWTFELDPSALARDALRSSTRCYAALHR